MNELALALEDTSAVILLALVLAYPSGRLETRVDRAAVAILAVGVTGLNILYSTSLTIIADKSSGLYGGLALAIMTSVVVLRRWLIAPARSRRDLLPVLVAGAVFLATLIINIVRRIVDVPDDVGADPRRGEGPCAGRHPDRPAHRVLSPERAPPAGRGRRHPGPDVPVRP